jgi:hypothetical protein
MPARAGKNVRATGPAVNGTVRVPDEVNSEQSASSSVWSNSSYVSFLASFLPLRIPHCTMANDTPEMNDVAETFYFWLRWISSALTLLIMTFGGMRWIAISLAAFRLSMSRIDSVRVPDGEFVRRSKDEKELLDALKSDFHDTVFVYGERGSGKTSLIRHALQERRGVFEMKLFGQTDADVTAEFISKLSKGVDMFRCARDSSFVEDVFTACWAWWVEPIVVISLDKQCKGEVLEAVLVLCKSLAYERREKTARFIVSLSGSRAAIDASIGLSKLRCVGVHIGNLEEPEALLYTTDRIPTSFTDPLRRNQIAELVVNVFDGHALTLQKICRSLRNGKPGDFDDVSAIIEKSRKSAEESALRGWKAFCKSLFLLLGTDYDAAAVEEMVVLLLKEPQPVDKILTLLSRKSVGVPMDAKDIGLFNADAGFHPLDIDPFEITLSLSGKAIAAVLRKKNM